MILTAAYARVNEDMDMDLKKLAATLIPDKALLAPEEYESVYPQRELEKGAEVTIAVMPVPMEEAKRFGIMIAA